MTYELKMPILGFDDVKKIELEKIDETLDLDESRGDKVELYCVVVVQKPIENSIVNLIAPFVFNPANGFCLQVTTLPVAQYPQFSKVQPLKEFLSNEILQTLNQ